MAHAGRRLHRLHRTGFRHRRVQFGSRRNLPLGTMMDKFLTTVADKLWVWMEPKLTQLITDVINQTMETWLPKLGDLVEENLDAKMAEWLPKIIKAVIIATSQAVRGIAVDSEDKLTNLIPGTMDDAVFDPIFKNVSDIIGKIGL